MASSSSRPVGGPAPAQHVVDFGEQRREAGVPGDELLDSADDRLRSTHPFQQGPEIPGELPSVRRGEGSARGDEGRDTNDALNPGEAGVALTMAHTGEDATYLAHPMRVRGSRDAGPRSHAPTTRIAVRRHLGTPSSSLRAGSYGQLTLDLRSTGGGDAGRRSLLEDAEGRNPVLEAALGPAALRVHDGGSAACVVDSSRGTSSSYDDASGSTAGPIRDLEGPRRG
jgi:hypothetical protein